MHDFKMKIKATYLKRYFENGDPDDQRPPFYVCAFTKVVDELGKKLPDFATKEIKLLKAVEFQKGVQYEITFDEHRVPVEISWGKAKEKVYKKNSNSIIRVDKDGKETNLSANTPRQFIWQMIQESRRNQAKKGK